MKRVFLGASTTLGVVAVFAGSALAAHPTACQLVTAAEYRQVFGRTVKLLPGEGSSSCNVLVGGSFAHGIIPNINPYDAAYVKRMLATMRGKQRVTSLGPVGYIVIGTDGSVTSYAEKSGWFIAFQGLKKGNLNKAQAITLTRIALSRI